MHLHITYCYVTTLLDSLWYIVECMVRFCFLWKQGVGVLPGKCGRGICSRSQESFIRWNHVRNRITSTHNETVYLACNSAFSRLLHFPRQRLNCITKQMADATEEDRRFVIHIVDCRTFVFQTFDVVTWDAKAWKKHRETDLRNSVSRFYCLAGILTNFIFIRNITIPCHILWIGITQILEISEYFEAFDKFLRQTHTREYIPTRLCFLRFLSEILLKY